MAAAELLVVALGSAAHQHPVSVEMIDPSRWTVLEFIIKMVWEDAVVTVDPILGLGHIAPRELM
jgi:hypothetical protein